MLKRLRLKFVCINMAIVTVMLAVIMGTVLSFTRANLAARSMQMMRAAAAAPTLPGPAGIPGQQVETPHFILRLDRSGRLLYAGSSYYDLSDRDFLLQLIAQTEQTGASEGVLTRYDLRFCRVSTPREEVLVFADMTMENEALAALTRTCALIAAGSFVIFLVISVLLARWAVKPVDTAWQQQKQFVADASHELKTPLTVITTNAELLLAQSQPPEQTRFGENILTMSRQMRTLVEQLLDLARVDNGCTPAAFREADLSALVADSLLPFEPLFFEQGLLLREELTPGIRLKGSPEHLARLPDILLDNALKYADPNTEVTVRLKRQGLHCLLSVSNFGPPIPKEEQKNIFKRFYRSDKARTRNGSYGLGLSIAQSIVETHRGRIWCESTGGVNMFYIQLPL